MPTLPAQPLPTTRQLLKATALAIAVAAVLLITIVLPAEYGLDPTGIGKRLGLDVLSSTSPAPEAEQAPPSESIAGQDPNAVLAAKARQAFGAFPGQSFDAKAVSQQTGVFRQDALTVVLPPGKGAEIKAALKSGAGIVFAWTATGPVALDMHGERAGAKEAWTTYAVEASQQKGSGTFVAPFEGSHGWYWLNRGTEPVTVEVEVDGFQEKLYRPGHE